jgi:hypothetical protein
MLVANQPEMQLGTLQFGAPHSFKYVLTNNSDTANINIVKLVVGCGSCTTAKMDKNTLAPHESADVDVVFTPGSTGLQNKNISIAYNMSGNVMPALILKFKATVNG